MSNFTIELNLQQSHRQVVDVTQRVLGLLPIIELVKIFEKLDLKANPRDAKKSTITKEIQTTLSEQPAIFPLKSKGILLSASEFSSKSEGQYVLTFTDLSKEGIIDGGHNSLAIGQFILDRSLEYSVEDYRCKSKNWTDFKKEFNKYRPLISKYVSSNEGKRSLATLVSIEILLPKSLSSHDIEGFNDALRSIQSARNNNAQVTLSALMNNESLYDELKKNIPDGLNKNIQWRTNESDKSIKSEDIVALTWIPLNALLISMKKDNKFFYDKDNKKIQPINAPQLYSSKNSCVKQFKRVSESPDFIDLKDTKLQHSVFELAGQMPEIFDYIYLNFPKEFDRFSSKKFKSIDKVRDVNEKRAQKKTPYYDKSVDLAFPEAYVYPLIYSLNKNIKVGSKLEWIEDPIKFLDKNLSLLIDKYNVAYMRGLKYEPQHIGKKKDIYIYLEEVTENLI